MKRITLQDFDQYLKNYGDENEYPPLRARATFPFNRLA